MHALKLEGGAGVEREGVSPDFCIISIRKCLFHFDREGKPWEDKEGCTGVEFGEEV